MLSGPSRELSVGDRAALVDDVRAALWASKVVAYAQGLEQIRNQLRRIYGEMQARGIEAGSRTALRLFS